jgi:hypothetical protein
MPWTFTAMTRLFVKITKSRTPSNASATASPSASSGWTSSRKPGSSVSLSLKTEPLSKSIMRAGYR